MLLIRLIVARNRSPKKRQFGRPRKNAARFFLSGLALALQIISQQRFQLIGRFSCGLH